MFKEICKQQEKKKIIRQNNQRTKTLCILLNMKLFIDIFHKKKKQKKTN